VGFFIILTRNKYTDILISMKIRFLRDIIVDVEKPRLDEIWDKNFRKWDEIRVTEIFPQGSLATLKTDEGDFILSVPKDSFERIEEKKKMLSL
jgi:hypothetical protein